MKKSLITLGLVGAITGGTALADETFLDDRFYIAPFGTFLYNGGDSHGYPGWGAGAGVGKIINEYFNVEVRGFWQNFGNDINGLGGHTDLAGGTIDLQYYFMRDTFSPYAVLALGGMNTSQRYNPGRPGVSGGTQYGSFIFEVGVGATLELADNFLLRGDVRYRGNVLPDNIDGDIRFLGQRQGSYSPNNDVLNDMVVNLGFVIPLGEKPQPAAPVAPPAECVDEGKDTDHDGVTDCNDRCPGTMENTKVDDQGCPIVMELRGVNFKFDSDELTEGAMAILDGVVEQLVSFPEQRDIEVAGYASDEGYANKRAYNLKLSQRRSESVVSYLKGKGVTNKLFAKGYGVEYPIADNSTEAGRIKNRRVELRWMGD